jgi:hypothetical protein
VNGQRFASFEQTKRRKSNLNASAGVMIWPIVVVPHYGLVACAATFL